MVLDLAVFDDGGGPALYAAGIFHFAGGVAARNVAKWDGTNWTPLGSGTSALVSALAVFDDGRGGGPALYAGGSFTAAGGVQVGSIAKWNGSSWSRIGSGIFGQSAVYALTVFDDGGSGRPALIAGGYFTSAGGVAARSIAKWDGMQWGPLGSGVGEISPFVDALTAIDDPSGGSSLYVGGSFTSAIDSGDSYLARWQGCPRLPKARRR